MARHDRRRDGRRLVRPVDSADAEAHPDADAAVATRTGRAEHKQPCAHFPGARGVDPGSCSPPHRDGERGPATNNRNQRRHIKSRTRVTAPDKGSIP